MRCLDDDFTFHSKARQEWKQNFPQYKGKENANRFTASYIFNNHVNAADKFEALMRNDKIPDNIIAVAYHRRFYKKTHSLFSDKQP